MYKVIHPKVSVQEFSDLLCTELAEKRTGFPKTIVYIRKFRDYETIYGHLKKTLGASITEPPAYPYHISKFRLVDMFTSVLSVDKKEQVLKLFTEPEGNLRLLVATTSFGMGIDFPDTRQIIHWGIPTTVEEYVPLKYAPDGRRPYFIGFKCAGFLTNAAVSEKKRVKTWLIEIALRVTPPLKVHVLSR